MTDFTHLHDELHDLMDGRLEEADRRRVDLHLAACRVCRREYESLLRLRENVRDSLSAEDAPPGLVALIGTALDREERRGGSRRRMAPLWLALGAAAAAVVAILIWLPRRDLPSAAARDLTLYRSGALSLEIQTSDAARLERFFRTEGIQFPTRVFDLRMMRYEILGGRTHSLAGRKSALWVYQGPEGRILLCEMFEGGTEELPKALRRDRGGISFFVYRRKGSTQIFWQEGNVTCALVSDAPMEEALALAFAKAMRV